MLDILHLGDPWSLRYGLFHHQLLRSSTDWMERTSGNIRLHIVALRLHVLDSSIYAWDEGEVGTKDGTGYTRLM